MSFRRLAAVLAALTLSACAPMLVQQPNPTPVAFQGPRLEAETFVSFDGARLGLSRWAPAAEPWAVVVGLHGMNDYANAFHFAGAEWAKAGIATYAYDQRGFGRSPNRGVWGGDALMVEDLRTITRLVRQAYPKAIVVVAGESMGGSVAIEAFASDDPPPADRLILLSPGVWGWSTQPLPYKTLLWLTARLTASKVYTPPDWLVEKVRPTDNREELIAMSRDPLMIWGARSDAIYGLVAMMERASRQTGTSKVPTLYLYGAHDDIIPKKAAFRAVRGLKPEQRSAYYARGHHLMTRDLQRQVVIDDIAAFIAHPEAPLPSAPPPIPRSRRKDPQG